MTSSARDDCCTDCIGRIPYASLIAFILTCVGVGLFCGMTYQGVNASVNQIKKLNLFPHDVTWLDKIPLMFVIVAVIMCIVALMLLIVGALATGSTRTQVYSGWRARLGGRISCACFLVFTYLLNFCWLIVLGFIAIFSAVYCMFGVQCRVAQANSQCLNYTVVSPIVNGTTRLEPLVLCGQDRMDFCQLSNQASMWYGIGLIGCLILIKGLINYLICLSANYAHIKDGFKYSQLEEIRTNEENEMMGTYGQRSVYRQR